MLKLHSSIIQIQDWKDSLSTPKPADDIYPQPREILEAVNEIKADDDIIATDVGQHQMWVAQYCRFESKKTLLTSGGMGTMGFGMGAAIGAQVSHLDKRVFLVTGDGSFHMNLNELVTLKSYDLPVIVLVMNNTVLGMVRQWQKLFYESRFSQTDPHRATDFVALANAFGIDGMRITTHKSVFKPYHTSLQRYFNIFEF